MAHGCCKQHPLPAKQQQGPGPEVYKLASGSSSSTSLIAWSWANDLNSLCMVFLICNWECLLQLLQGLHELISQEYYKDKKNYLTKLLEGLTK